MLTFLLSPMTADEGRKLVERTDDRKRVVEMEERLFGRDVLDESTEQEHRQRYQDSKKSAIIASSTQLAKFAVYYYRRRIDDDYDCIRSYMIEWIENSLSSAHPKEFRYNKLKSLRCTPQLTVSPGRTSRTPIRRSFRKRTPTPQAHQRQSTRQNCPTPLWSQADQKDGQAPYEDDLDDIDDGVDAEKSFPHWVEYLEEVFEDAELGSNFTASYEDSLFRNWDFEETPTPDNTPFPDTDGPMFLQERNVRCIRALKSPLAALFARSNSHNPPS
ncbi:hypothetical protein GN958_ATG06242 [Phytophthora infestans]|uniref:Uncharacterized protein n=1 Tax=Phytophthora infestans TaxID=4787 RepID=A0A8S9UXU3_PHYIN|nr:hypothetical protein GN958_ATG06242 [Phytophthora infestans]